MLWRFIFGGLKLTPHQIQNRATLYQDLKAKAIKVNSLFTPPKNCAFCKDSVIHEQEVLKGRKVRAFYNCAPIVPGEKLHFLLLPIRHAKTFTSLTKEEHREIFTLARTIVRRLQSYFKKKGAPLGKAYIYHKTGSEAGQSINHFHVHLVLTQNEIQDTYWGYLIVLRNILLKWLIPFRLSDEELAEKKAKYTHILKMSYS